MLQPPGVVPVVSDTFAGAVTFVTPSSLPCAKLVWALTIAALACAALWAYGGQALSYGIGLLLRAFGLEEESGGASVSLRFNGPVLRAEVVLRGVAALEAARKPMAAVVLGPIELAEVYARELRADVAVQLQPLKLRAAVRRARVRTVGARLVLRPSADFCAGCAGFDSSRADALAFLDMSLVGDASAGPIERQREVVRMAARALGPLDVVLEDSTVLYVHEVTPTARERTGGLTEEQILLSADMVRLRDVDELDAPAGPARERLKGTHSAANVSCFKRFAFEGVVLASRMGVQSDRTSPFEIGDRILHRWKGAIDARFASARAGRSIDDLFAAYNSSTWEGQGREIKPPEVAIAASLQAAKVTITSTKLLVLMGVLSYYSVTDFAVKVKALRPKRSVLERPAEWWRWAAQMAIRAVRQEACQARLEARLVRLLGRTPDGSWGRSTSLIARATRTIDSAMETLLARYRREGRSPSRASDLLPLTDQEEYMAEYLRQLDRGKLGWDCFLWNGPVYSLEEVIILRCLALDRRERASRRRLDWLVSRFATRLGRRAHAGNVMAKDFTRAMAHGRAGQATKAVEWYREADEAAGALVHVAIECARVDVHLFTNATDVAVHGLGDANRPLRAAMNAWRQGRTNSALVLTLGGLGLRWEVGRMDGFVHKGVAAVGCLRLEQRRVSQMHRGDAAIPVGEPNTLMEAGDTACMHHHVRSAVAMFERDTLIDWAHVGGGRAARMAPRRGSTPTTPRAMRERFLFVSMHSSRTSSHLTVELAPMHAHLTPRAFGQAGELGSVAGQASVAIAPPFDSPVGASWREMLAAMRAGRGRGLTQSRRDIVGSFGGDAPAMTSDAGRRAAPGDAAYTAVSEPTDHRVLATIVTLGDDEVGYAFPNLIARLRPGDPDRLAGFSEPVLPETAIDVRLGGAELVVEGILDSAADEAGSTPEDGGKKGYAAEKPAPASPSVHLCASACAFRGGRGLAARSLLCSSGMAGDLNGDAASDVSTTVSDDAGLVLLPAFEGFSAVALPVVLEIDETSSPSSDDHPWQIYRVRAGFSITLHMASHPPDVFAHEESKSPAISSPLFAGRRRQQAIGGARPFAPTRSPGGGRGCELVEIPLLMPCIIDAGFAQNTMAVAVRPGQHPIVSRALVVRMPNVEVHLRPQTVAGTLLLLKPFKDAADKAVATVQAAAAGNAATRLRTAATDTSRATNEQQLSVVAAALPTAVSFEVACTSVSALHSTDNLALVTFLTQDVAACVTTASKANALEADVRVRALAVVDEDAARRSMWGRARMAAQAVVRESCAADLETDSFLAGPEPDVPAGFSVPAHCVLFGSEKGFGDRQAAGDGGDYTQITRGGHFTSRVREKEPQPFLSLAAWKGRSGHRAPYRVAVRVAAMRALFSPTVVEKALNQYCSNADVTDALCVVLDGSSDSSEAQIAGDGRAALQGGSRSDGVPVQADGGLGVLGNESAPVLHSMTIDLKRIEAGLLDGGRDPLAMVDFALAAVVSQKLADDVSIHLQVTNFTLDDFCSAEASAGGVQDADDVDRPRPPPQVSSTLRQSDGQPGKCSVDVDVSSISKGVVDIASECEDFCFVMDTSLISNIARDIEEARNALLPLAKLPVLARPDGGGRATGTSPAASGATQGDADEATDTSTSSAASTAVAAVTAHAHFGLLSVRLLDVPCFVCGDDIVPAPPGAECILSFHDFLIDVDVSRAETDGAFESYPGALLAAQASLVTLGHARSRADSAASVWDARFAATSIRAINPTLGLLLPGGVIQVVIDVPEVEADIAEWQFYQLMSLIYWHAFGSPAPRERAGAASSELRTKIHPSPATEAARVPDTDEAVRVSESDAYSTAYGTASGEAFQASSAFATPGSPPEADTGARTAPVVHVILRLPLVRGLIVGQMLDTAIECSPFIDSLVAPPQYPFKFEGAELSIKVYAFSQIRDGCNFLELAVSTKRLVLLDDTVVINDRDLRDERSGVIRQTPMVRSDDPAYAPAYHGRASFPRQVTEAWFRPGVRECFTKLESLESSAAIIFESPRVETPGANFTYVMTGKRLNAVMHLNAHTCKTYWPYFLDAPVLWMLGGTFSSYVMGQPREPPTDPPTPRPWTYFNFSCTDFMRMFWPTLQGGRHEDICAVQPSAKADEGVVLTANSFAINYSFGGFGECVFKVLANDVAGSVRQKGSRVRLLKPASVIYEQQYKMAYIDTKSGRRRGAADAAMSTPGSPPLTSPARTIDQEFGGYATARAQHDSDEESLLEVEEDGEEEHGTIEDELDPIHDAPRTYVPAELQITQVDSLSVDNLNVAVPLSAIRVIRSLFDLGERWWASQDLPGYGYPLMRGTPAPRPPPTKSVRSLQAATSYNYSLSANFNSVDVTLVHDLIKVQRPVVRVSASEFAIERASYSAPGVMATSDAESKAAFALELFNTTREALEPVLEPWRCELLHTRRGYDSRTLRSSERADIVVTPEHIPALEAIPTFRSAWFTPVVPVQVSPGRAESLPPVVVNHTGTDLYFWMLETKEDGDNPYASDPETDSNGGEKGLGARSSRRSVSSTGVETLARVLAQGAAHSLPFATGTLMIQLDGGWRPFPPIPLHAGAQTWAVSCESLVTSPRPLKATLVAEVTVRPDGAKFLELHSTLRLRNNTNCSLTAHLRLRDATSAATMTGEVERTLELGPDGSALWIPVTFLTGRGMLELRAGGYQWAADHVELTTTTAGLLSAQRVVTFDPEVQSDRSDDGLGSPIDDGPTRSMRCCLQVSGADSAIASDPADDPRSSRSVVSHALVLSPPMIVRNRLPRPYAIDVALRQSRSGDESSQQTSYSAALGQTRRSAAVRSGSGNSSRLPISRASHLSTGEEPYGTASSSGAISFAGVASCLDGFRRVNVGDSHGVYDFDVEDGPVDIVVQLEADGKMYSGSCRGPILGTGLSKEEREALAGKGQKVTLVSTDGSHRHRRLHIFVRVHRRAMGETAQAGAQPSPLEHDPASAGCLGSPMPVDSPGATWDIELYAPYWVLNMTGLPLEIKDAGRHRKLSVSRAGLLALDKNKTQVALKPINQTAQQWADRWHYEESKGSGRRRGHDEVQRDTARGASHPGARRRSTVEDQSPGPDGPALFWASRGQVRLCSKGSDWSSKIDVDKVGTGGVVRLVYRRRRTAEGEYLSSSNTVRAAGLRRQCLGHVGVTSTMSEVWRVHEIAVSIHLASEDHPDSRIILLSPYIIVSNRSEMRLAFGQMGYVDVTAESVEAERAAFEETSIQRTGSRARAVMQQDGRARVFMRNTEGLSSLHVLDPDTVTQFHWQPTARVDSATGGWPEADPQRRSLEMTVRAMPEEGDTETPPRARHSSPATPGRTGPGSPGGSGEALSSSVSWVVEDDDDLDGAGDEAGPSWGSSTRRARNARMWAKVTRSPCEWSSPFRVDEVGEFSLRLRRTDTGERMLLPVYVKPEGSSLVVVFGPPNAGPAPYAISNETRFACAYFCQKNTESQYGWSCARPLSKEPFSWDMPLRPHVLTLQLTNAWSQPAPGAPRRQATGTTSASRLSSTGGSATHTLVTKDLDIDDISPQSHNMLILRAGVDQNDAGDTPGQSRRWASRQTSRRASSFGRRRSNWKGKEKATDDESSETGSEASDPNAGVSEEGSQSSGGAGSSGGGSGGAGRAASLPHSVPDTRGHGDAARRLPSKHRRSMSLDDNTGKMSRPLGSAQQHTTAALARARSKAAQDLWHTAAGLVAGGAARAADAAATVFAHKQNTRRERTVFIRVVANGPTRELIISEVPVEDNKFRDEEVAMLKDRLNAVTGQLRQTDEQLALLMAAVQQKASVASAGSTTDVGPAGTSAKRESAASGGDHHAGAQGQSPPTPDGSPALDRAPSATLSRKRSLSRVTSELVRVPDHVQQQPTDAVPSEEEIMSPRKWEALANSLAPSNRQEAAMMRSASSMLRRLQSSRSSRMLSSRAPSSRGGLVRKGSSATHPASPRAMAAPGASSAVPNARRMQGVLSTLGGVASGITSFSSDGATSLGDIAEETDREAAAAKNSGVTGSASEVARTRASGFAAVDDPVDVLDAEPATADEPHDGTYRHAAAQHLGGELHVRVCSARGLGVELFAAGGQGLRRPPPPDKLNPYVAVEVEAATAHTRKLRGTSAPRWDEVLQFSGVSSRSVLKAQVWHGREFGEDLFLGEVYVNLEGVPPPVDDGAVYTLRLLSTSRASAGMAELYDPSGAILATPSKWLALGRRGQNDHVSGELELAVCWNVSPIDSVGLELRAREQELAVKNQLLAILEHAAAIGGAHSAAERGEAVRAQQRTDAAARADADAEAARKLTRDARQLAASALRAGRDGMAVALRGQYKEQTDKGRAASEVIRRVVVRVIEARNLHAALQRDASAGNDMRVRRSSCNAFVRLRVKATGARGKTSVRASSFTPAWNETFEFDSVPVTSHISVRVFNKKRVLRGELLGKASVHLHRLEQGRAHFMWLRLMPPGSEAVGDAETEFGHNISASRIASSGHPEVRLRIQLVTTGQPSLHDLAHAAENVRDYTAISLRGIGVSVLDPHSSVAGSFGRRGAPSGADAESEDLVHLYLGHITCEWKRHATEEQVNVVVEDLQIDNQLRTANLPVMVTQTPREPPRPVLEISGSVQKQMPGVRHFAYFSILMQELDITVEEDFLDRFVGFVRKLPRNQLLTALLLAAVMDSDDPHDAMRMVDTPVIRASAANPTVYSYKLYFDLLHLHPVRLNVSVVASPASPAELATRRDRFSVSSGLPVVTIKSAPMFLESKVFEHVFISRGELLLRLALHYRAKALQEIYKILGSAEFLGQPTQLLSSMGTGFASLFYDPVAGLVYNPNAEDFGISVAKGGKRLVVNTLYAISTTVSAVTGSLGSNVGRIAAPGGVAGGSGGLAKSASAQRRRATARSILNARGRVVGVRGTFGFMGGAVAEGAGDLYTGVAEGLGGLVIDPIAGAGQGGVTGFVGGVATGAVGAIARPVSGFFTFVSKSFGGAARATDERRVITARVREPRVGESTRRREHHRTDFAVRSIIFGAKNGRYRDDPVVEWVLVAAPMVVVITQSRAMLVNSERGTVVWTVQLANVVEVKPDFEEAVIVYSPHLAASKEVNKYGDADHAQSELRRWAVGVANRINSVSRWRKRVYCISTDTRDRLVRMLRHALEGAAAAAAAAAGSTSQATFSGVRRARNSPTTTSAATQAALE